MYVGSCAVGTLEYRAALESVRRYTPNVTYHQAWVDSVGAASDPNAKLGDADRL